MKKIYFLVGIFLVMSLASIGVGHSTGFFDLEESNPGEGAMIYSVRWNYPGSQIASMKYEPYPVSAGEYFDFWVKAELGSSANYVKFELVESFPFSIDTNENAIREFKNLERTQVFIQYKIRVDNNAVEGINELYLKQINKEGISDGIIYSFDIVVNDYRTDFDAVIHDFSGNDVAIAIANAGKNEAGAVVVRIPQQEDFRIIGTDGQMVGSLGKGDYTLVGFVIEPTKDTTEFLEIEIHYTDALGERRVVNKELILETTPTVEKEEKNERSLYLGISISNYVILALVIAGIIYYIYRKKNMSRNNGSKRKSTEIPEWIKKNKEK